MRRLAEAAAVVAVLGLVAEAARGWTSPEAEEAAPPIERLDSLPLDGQVRDPVFAILTGLLRSGSYGVLSRDQIERELLRRKARSRLPYRELVDLSRVAVEPGRTAVVTARFDGPVDVPIPYTILFWYHPGRVEATRACVLREWILGDVRLPHDDRGRPSTVELADVHLFGLEEGRLEVDIDGWIDGLMGAALDDTDLVGLAFFRHHGRPIAVAVGYNRTRRGRSGAFDLAADKVLFPVPAEMRTVGRLMRRQVEALRQAGSPPRKIGSW